LLSKLISTKKPGSNRTVIQETVANPSINEEETHMVIEEEDWRTPIIKYLQRDELPKPSEEAYRVRRMASWYSMMGDKLYKRGFSSPLLLCVSKEEAKGILEEIQNDHVGAT
jgi:t-SNARE complex subunit (syntaxin)